MLKVRSALFSVSDKTEIVELARALVATGTRIYASGGTQKTLVDAGIAVEAAEKLSKSPEAFGGRMKTLSYPIFGGILFRRGDETDLKDAKRLELEPIDCVVVNFYPFEKEPSIEQIDIGGPALVRAAAKNSPDVLVLTDPAQYGQVIGELNAKGTVTSETADRCRARAWTRVFEYDQAIARVYGDGGDGAAGVTVLRELRYGENPHQKARVIADADSPIDWTKPLTATELSYNNILDLSAAYRLLGDLVAWAGSDARAVVIVKHGNPCGVALVSEGGPEALSRALELAWAGDPISAFGGVIAFSHPIDDGVAKFLKPYFIELIGAPEMTAQSQVLQAMLQSRKNLKAVRFNRVEPDSSVQVTGIAGGKLEQTNDAFEKEESLKSMTRAPFEESRRWLAQFGILVTKALKSNAVALVREVGRSGSSVFQLLGAGQGQPNRIDSLMKLAVPRAKAVLGDDALLDECVLVSDAFFPFPDVVREAHQAGIRHIVQPGGSIKDADSVAACDELGVRMAFSGVRHFRH